MAHCYIGTFNPICINQISHPAHLDFMCTFINESLIPKLESATSWLSKDIMTTIQRYRTAVPFSFWWLPVYAFSEKVCERRLLLRQLGLQLGTLLHAGIACGTT